MRRSRQWLVATSVVGIAFGAALIAVQVERARERERWGMLESYCTECHNSLDLAGELSFEKLTPDTVPQHAEVFEAVVNKLRGRLMPPPGSPQPEQAKIDAMIAWLERSIDAGAAQHEVGYVPAQRLSRTEYASAVKDLLGVEIDPTEHLPAEIEVDGFTNIAAALSVSPAFIEQYVNVASTVAHLAVGEPVPKVATAHFPPPAARPGGLHRRHAARHPRRLAVHAHISGRRRVSPHAFRTSASASIRAPSKREHTLVVLVDRNEVFRGDIGGDEDLARSIAAALRPRGDHESVHRHSHQRHGGHAPHHRHVHRALARGERRADLDVHAEPRASATRVRRACPASSAAST